MRWLFTEYTADFWRDRTAGLDSISSVHRELGFFFNNERSFEEGILKFSFSFQSFFFLDEDILKKKISNITWILEGINYP